MWRHSKLIGFICDVAALLAGLYLPAYWDATEIARRDRQIADDIDAELVKFFSSLGPEHEITRRYGNYVAILGTDHARHRGYLQAPAVVLPRRIDFEKGSVTAYIRVQSRAPTQLRARLMPSEESLADKPGYSIEQRTRPTATAPHVEKLFADNPWYRIEYEAVELRIVWPKSNVLSTIELNASHPQYVTDRSELHHLRRVQDQTDQPIADLVDSVRSGEVDRAKSVQVWLEAPNSSASVEAFITRAMNESDPAVRLQAAKALTQIGNNGTWHLAPETLELVFSHLFDPAQDPAVRDELLRAALQSDQDSVSDLMERLKSAADGGRFAVPTVTAWLGDRSRSHWTVGYASSGPVRTMEFLERLGPDAAHATTVLTMIAKEHPNQWNFRVAAVNALGAIGPDASESLPTLNLLTSSSYGNLVQASRAAIARIDSDAILPEDYEIQFDSAKTQSAFIR